MCAALLLLLTCGAVLQAQPRCDIRHYSFSDGLSQSVVQRLVQSADGRLWFCTWDGLNSYDGTTFVSYNMASPGGKALSTNRIIDIQLGGEDDLWCQTYDNRLFLFNQKEQAFIDVLTPLETSLRKPLTVDSYQVLPKGVAWLTTRSGEVFRIDGRAFKTGTDGVEHYATDGHPLKSNRIYRIYEDREGDEWVLTHKGVDVVGLKRVKAGGPAFRYVCECAGQFYLVSEANKLYRYRREQGDFEKLNVSGYQGAIHWMESAGRDTLVLQTSHSVTFYACKSRTAATFRMSDIGRAKEKITAMCTDSRHHYWLMLERGEMVRLNPSTLEARLYGLPPSSLSDADLRSRSLLFSDHNGTLWAIAKYGPLCYYDETTDRFLPYLRDADNPTSFYVPTFQGYLMDRQGNLWLALDMGLARLSFQPHFFTFHLMEKNMDIRAFLADNKGRLWASSKSGVVRVRQQDGGPVLYLSSSGKLVTEKCAFGPKVYAMLQTRDGDIWLGTREDGLFRLHPADDHRFTLHHYTSDSSDACSLSSNRIFDLHEDCRGHLWVGTFGGGLNLVERNPESGSARFIHAGNRLKSFPADVGVRIRCPAETPDGILLAGTTDGLLAFRTSFARPEEIVFHHHRHVSGDDASLNSNHIMDIFQPRGTEQVYCLGFSGGLNLVSPDSLLHSRTTFHHYTVQDGLISNLVHSMAEDGRGHYWVTTENGLSCLDPLTGQSVNYPCDRFRAGLRFAETVPLVMGDTLFLGTNLGVLELDLSKLPHDAYVPPVLLTEMRVQGNPLTGDVNRMKSLTLSPSQRNISFRFAAVDFVSPSTIQYAYRLRGLDDTWNKVENARSASYMNLPAGEYTLEIRSTNNNGVWMDNVRSLRLIVEPKFSETAWAWVLYAGLFLLLVGTVCYVLFYIYRLRHRIDTEQQLADIKLRFFTDISHELRTPLTLISAPVDEMLQSRTLSEQDRKHLSLVHVNIRRMLRMMNQILDFRRLQNHKMKLVLEEADLVALLRQVMAHFQAVAGEKHMDFSLSTPVEKLPMWLDVDKVEKVFFNLLSNAFKYTPAEKTVTVEVELADTEVRVSVADKGIGIDEQHRKTLFQRFETFGHSDMMHPSSGIGLSLVKELVDLHHGHIDVESRLGEGSRFTVTLPLNRTVYEHDRQTEFILNDGLLSASPVREEDVPETGDERPTLLVVEDNDELRSFLREILSGTYHVLEASDGKQGLELAAEHVPDLIVTDVMMPVMDGLEMVRHVKADRRICHIPIVVLSAKSSLDDRIEGLEHGIDDYLAKPFSSAYLKTRIASLLRQRRELQELYMARLQTSPTKEPVPEVPDSPRLEPYDAQFMKQVTDCVEQNMTNPDFEIEQLAEHLNVCRTVFYRKLKSITGLTPVAFVGELRLKRAIRLMEQADLSISQVAYMTGFKSPKYFSTVFKKATGCTPSEYRERKVADAKGGK